MGSIIMRIMTSVIEAWRLLDSVRRRFGDDVPAAGQEECFHAFNLHVHDVILDAHLQVLIRHASKMEEGGRELLPWFLSAPAATVCNQASTIVV
uniref:Uncharacterized protein n=1 Tax=Aegilops tauschii subsp. strangulata TaxID=200361 RepID=A0A453IB51_AEGTS